MGHRTITKAGGSLRGAGEAVEKLENLLDTLKQAGAQTLAEASLHMLEEAAKNAPAETGSLRGSGYVDLDGKAFAKAEQRALTPDQVSRGQKPPPPRPPRPLGPVPDEATRATIGFHCPYAAARHEQIACGHPEAVGGKFLERALLEEQQTLPQRMLEGLSQAMNGGDF